MHKPDDYINDDSRDDEPRLRYDYEYDYAIWDHEMLAWLEWLNRLNGREDE